MFLIETFSRRSGDKSSPPCIAPPTLGAPGLREEKQSVQAASALQGDMRRLTLEGEEGENRAAQQTSLSEVSEDPSISSPTPPDPPDSKTLQGMALGGCWARLLWAAEAEALCFLWEQHQSPGGGGQRPYLWSGWWTCPLTSHLRVSLVPVCPGCGLPPVSQVSSGCSWPGRTVRLDLFSGVSPPSGSVPRRFWELCYLGPGPSRAEG